MSFLRLRLTNLVFFCLSPSQGILFNGSLVPRPICAMRANRATSRRLGAKRDSARPGKNGKKVPDLGEKLPDLCFR